MNEYLQSVDIFKTMARFRKPLIIVGVISFLASAIFSGPAFIKPKFKSFAILYPTNLIVYSQESPTEQMIQLLQSSDIRNKIIASFNLYKHYEIDTVDNTHQQTDVNKLYEQNVSVNKTEYESAEIVVYDTDPAVASGIIDSMIHYMNLKARALQRQKSEELVAVAKHRLDAKKYEMDSVETLLQKYRDEYGILDYANQVKEYTRGLSNAMNSGSVRAADEIRAKLRVLGERGGEFVSMNEHVWRIRGAYNDLKIEYESALKDVNKELTYENVVTRPFASDKKAYPIRWLIVVVSVSTSLFLAFLALLMIDTRRN